MAKSKASATKRQPSHTIDDDDWEDDQQVAGGQLPEKKIPVTLLSGFLGAGKL